MNTEKFTYIGNCIDTVDTLNYWDATTMAQVVENEDAESYDISKLLPFIKDKTMINKINNFPDNFECQICTADNCFMLNCDIVWFYDIEEDIHYFFEKF